MKDLQREYQGLDFDQSGNLQRRIWTQICAKQTSFKRRTVLSLCSALAAVLIAVFVWEMLPAKASYLPSPGEMNRMQFAFYRELALPGQDLGISYDDFAPIQRRDL